MSLILNFDISVIAIDDIENIPKKGCLNIALSKYSKNNTGVNVMEIVQDNVWLEFKNGNAIGGNFIQIKESRKGSETGAHEIGHILGMDHTNSGLITAESSNPKRSKILSKRSIQEMLMLLRNMQVEHAGKGFIYNNSQYLNSELKKGNVTPINNL